jgi:hypothetical protein
MGFLPIYYGFFGRFLLAQFTAFTEVFGGFLAVGVFWHLSENGGRGFLAGVFGSRYINFDFAYKSTHCPLRTKYTLLYE